MKLAFLLYTIAIPAINVVMRGGDVLNFTLVLCVLGMVGYCLIVLLEPRAMRRHAAWLDARADAVENYNQFRAERYDSELRRRNLIAKEASGEAGA